MTSLCNTLKDEYTVPDSTTMIDKPQYLEGEDILLHDKDGFIYLGTIVQVLNNEEKCLIQFGDDSEKWAFFHDLHKVKSPEGSEDSSCIVCKGMKHYPNNQVLLCHYCRRGYHQNCHEPVIPSKFASIDAHWMCMKCVEKREIREKQKLLSTEKPSRPIAVNNNREKSSKRRCSLPYELASLNWDAAHQTNEEGKYCYCAQKGEWFRRMLQCCRCLQWFHDGCIKNLKYPLLNGDRFFLFLCSVCNHGNEERLMRLGTEMTLSDMAHLALFNLTLETGKNFHDLDIDVIPFLKDHWKYLQPSSEVMALSTAERRTKILAAFWQSKDRFTCGRESKKKQTMWGLKYREPPTLPTVLTPQTVRTLQLWSDAPTFSFPMLSEIESPMPTPSPPQTAKKRGAETSKKRTRSADTEAIQPKTAKRPRSMQQDPEMLRKLRVRQQQQQKVTSGEESVCDESSDDVKRQPLPPSRPVSNKPNKRKRTNADERSGSTSSIASASLLTTPVETSSDETSRSTLDVFIPPPKNFDGLNNPFCSLETSSVNRASKGSNSSYLVRPLKTRLSEKDIRITKTGEVKFKRFVRKWKRSDLTGSLFQANTQVVHATSDAYHNSKESVLNYFGIAERVARGEKYTVQARRVLPKGISQYLIHWENDSGT